MNFLREEKYVKANYNSETYWQVNRSPFVASSMLIAKNFRSRNVWHAKQTLSVTAGKFPRIEDDYRKVTVLATAD